jgi:CRP-like cAMP-binding protein
MLINGPKPRAAAQVIEHKLGKLAPLTGQDIDLIRSTMPNKVRDIPGGVRVPPQRRLLKSLVVSGWLGRLSLFADGRRQVISTMVPGELVQFHQNPFIDSITIALIDAQLADLTSLMEALDEKPDRHPQLRAALSLAAQLEEAQIAEQVVRLGRRTAFERLGHWLLDLQHRLALAGVCQGERFAMPLTQDLLSDVLGMSIVHINRIVKQLRREGLVEVRGGYVTILQPDRLRMITEYTPLPDLSAPALQRTAAAGSRLRL